MTEKIDEKDFVVELDGKMVTAEELLNNISLSKNKPSQEEIDKAELEYNELSTSFSTKVYEIGKIEEAEDVFKFFLNYLENHVFWTKNGWMGVIKLNDEVKSNYEVYKSTPETFKLGYQALEFTMFMLTNPGGIGLKSAYAIENVAELYIYIMEQVSAQLDLARLELKDIQFAYDKWVSMQQGFYLEKEDGVEMPSEEIENLPTT